MTRAVRFDDGRFHVPAEYVETIKKGESYISLINSTGYRHLLDYLEFRANVFLEKLKDASLSSDLQLKSNLLIKWREAEQTLQDVQIEVQRVINERKTVLEVLGQSVGSNLDVPINFGGEE